MYLSIFRADGRYDQEVGYTQGLAFIVAALLLNVSYPTLGIES